MIKKINKLLDKIIDHTSDIVFGIFSGVGLVFLTATLTKFITILLLTLQSYFVIIYICLYVFILLSTSISFAKGWFRVIYAASSLILSFSYVYTIIFGGVQ